MKNLSIEGSRHKVTAFTSLGSTIDSGLNSQVFPIFLAQALPADGGDSSLEALRVFLNVWEKSQSQARQRRCKTHMFHKELSKTIDHWHFWGELTRVLTCGSLKVKGNPYPELRSPEEIPTSICKFHWFSHGVDLKWPCSVLTQRRPQNECLNCHSAECLRILCGKEWLDAAQGAQDCKKLPYINFGIRAIAQYSSHKTYATARITSFGIDDSGRFVNIWSREELFLEWWMNVSCVVLFLTAFTRVCFLE